MNVVNVIHVIAMIGVCMNFGEWCRSEITNSGKPPEMAEKISKGKITKFINDNTLLNQIWIMDPKKKVSDILKENKIEKDIKVLNFTRYKVGEGV